MKFHAATTTLLTGREVPSFVGHTSSTHHEMRDAGTVVDIAGIARTASGKEQDLWQTTDVVIITSEKRDADQWSHPITTSSNSGTSAILQRRRWGRRGQGQGQGRRHLTKVLQSMEDNEPSIPNTLKNLKNVRWSSREGLSSDDVLHDDHTEVGEKNPKVDVISECDLTAADIGILACPGENEICVPRIPGQSNLGGICIEEANHDEEEQERQLQQTMTPTNASTGYCEPLYCECANYDVESFTGSFVCTDHDNYELCPDSGILLTTVATYNIDNATFVNETYCIDFSGAVHQDLCLFYYYDDSGNFTCNAQIDDGGGTAAICNACFLDADGILTSLDCTNVDSYGAANNEQDFEIICQCEDALEYFPSAECNIVTVPDDGSGGAAGGGASGGNDGDESSSSASSVVIVATMMTTIGTAVVLAVASAIAC